MVDINEISSQEDKVNEFWKKAEVFRKSVEKKAPNGDYVFYDGPPFITGLPHYGTLLTSIPKDVVPRFQTMNGKRVRRVWGWDCHGLPAENKVEKQLGLKNKQDIERIGIGKFVNACKVYVKDVSDQWDWYIDKIARWVDMKNAYKTMDLNFMESVIWGFKQLYDKGLIYEGYRCSLHCPRCATPLSKFEITMDTGSYKDVTEISVIVEFPLIGEKDTNLLAWTTTPWTLPGNLALAINKNIEYVKIESEGRKFILAKDRLNEIFKDDKYKILEEFKGEKLIGKAYKPLFEIKDKSISDSDNAYKIYDADFVTTEDGTGIVHIAPNFGEDDFEFGKKHELPIIEMMDETGVYVDSMKDWKGLYFKDAGRKVLKKLEEKRLFAKFNYTHTYPFCYRCETSLIYKVQKAWYMDIDKIRNSMIKTNEKINWVPDYFKEGRFRHNLETAPHWCLSRSRYWGTPIPVWKCEKCNGLKVAGSIEEIEKFSRKKVTDLHRPEIDKHEFKCSNCNGKMKRVPEVFDCWFESGAMSYAQFHYPFENQNNFKNIFPADFIIEYTGQLRGWFYTLHAVSNALFKSEAYRNVVCHGVLAGTDGRKMSKSYGNYPDPKETLEKYGGDAIRMYFLTSPLFIGGDMNLSEKDIMDSLRKNVVLLLNVLQFYEEASDLKTNKKSVENILDKWILSRLNELNLEITKNMNAYNLPGATRPVVEFIEDLSTWYLRQTRERLNEGDARAIMTLREVLENLSKLIAPFMPFTAEFVWQKITKNNFKDKNKSVHLEKWPEVDKRKIKKDLSKEMKVVRDIVSMGLMERDKNHVGLKWPLSKVIIYSDNIKKYDKIIMEQLNIKKVEFKQGKNLKVELDFDLTPELEAEGYARELSRYVQAFRKKIGLQKKDKIELFIFVDKDFEDILKNQKNFIRDRTNAVNLEIGVATLKEKFKNKTDFKIKDKRGTIAINV